MTKQGFTCAMCLVKCALLTSGGLDESVENRTQPVSGFHANTMVNAEGVHFYFGVRIK